MIATRFDRERAMEVLRAFDQGKPIEPTSAQGWTPADLVLLAGVCFMVRAALGPDHLQDVKREDMPLEHREAHAARLFDDLSGAIRWSAEHARLAAEGRHAERFETVVVAVIDALSHTETPVAGFRKEGVAT